MPSSPSQFVWYELLTTDTEAAQAFYHQVFGWSAQAFPGMDYLILSAGERPVGGLMSLAQAKCPEGTPAHWIGYIGVEDVDAAAEQVKAAGGAVHVEPQDIPGVGRFAPVSDPGGAGFVLFRGATDAQPMDTGAPGTVGWRELYAADGAAAFDFYSALFGWTRSATFDMGPMGPYQLFAAGGADIGGMMTKPPQHPSPNWSFYFNVEGVDAAVARVETGGGKLTNGPMQVPTGQWVAQCVDPQGGGFNVVGPK